MTFPKAVFFDLDETLSAFDTIAPIAWERGYAAFMERNHPAFTAAMLDEARRRADAEYWSDPERNRWGRAHINESRRRIIHAALRSLGFCNDAEADRLDADVEGHLNALMHLLPGSRETLDALSGMGIRLALVTNGDSGVQRGKVKKFGIEDCFEALFIDTEIGFRKPDPRIFERALGNMSLSADDVWMVGDKLSRDVLGAKRAGLFAVWNDYRKTGLPEDAPAVPDLIIHSVTELPAILLALR